jgi:hypothetical protein
VVREVADRGRERGSVSSADLVELDKPISDDSGLLNAPGFRTRLQNDVPGTLPSANGQLDVEWALGADVGTDAGQALIAAFNTAGNAAGPGALALAGVATSKKDYLLGSSGTVEVTAPFDDDFSATLVGDTDDPVKCPGLPTIPLEDLQLSIDNQFSAEVSLHEQNATYFLANGSSKVSICHFNGHRGDIDFFAAHGFVDSAQETTMCRDSGGNVLRVNLNGALNGHLKA